MDLADRNLNPVYLIQRQSLSTCSVRQRLPRLQHAAPYPPTTPLPSRHPARLRQALAPHPQGGPRRGAALPPLCRSWPRHRSRPRRPHRAPASRHTRPRKPSTAVPEVPRCQDGLEEAAKGITSSISWQVTLGNRRGSLARANEFEIFRSNGTRAPGLRITARSFSFPCRRVGTMRVASWLSCPLLRPNTNTLPGPVLGGQVRLTCPLCLYNLLC